MILLRIVCVIVVVLFVYCISIEFTLNKQMFVVYYCNIIVNNEQSMVLQCVCKHIYN